jgi:hypothetical protein
MSRLNASANFEKEIPGFVLRKDRKRDRELAFTKECYKTIDGTLMPDDILIGRNEQAAFVAEELDVPNQYARRWVNSHSPTLMRQVVDNCSTYAVAGSPGLGSK